MARAKADKVQYNYWIVYLISISIDIIKDWSKCEKVDELKGSHNAEAKNETEQAAKWSWKDKVIAAYIVTAYFIGLPSAESQFWKISMRYLVDIKSL